VANSTWGAEGPTPKIYGGFGGKSLGTVPAGGKKNAQKKTPPTGAPKGEKKGWRDPGERGREGCRRKKNQADGEDQPSATGGKKKKKRTASRKKEKNPTSKKRGKKKKGMLGAQKKKQKARTWCGRKKKAGSAMDGREHLLRRKGGGERTLYGIKGLGAGDPKLSGERGGSITFPESTF